MNTVPRRLGIFSAWAQRLPRENGVSEYRECNGVLRKWDIVLAKRKADVEIGTLDPLAEPGAVIHQMSIIKYI